MARTSRPERRRSFFARSLAALTATALLGLSACQSAAPAPPTAPTSAPPAAVAPTSAAAAATT
ncbi:MAG: peptidylprolyl isomerase, partial [Chloroflexota bacterium]|nr:peptidylprolyl isomerase [Chloroflexota bacterium]